MRILAALLQYNLEKEGYGVAVCADGRGSPDADRRGAPGPGGSGLDAADRVRHRDSADVFVNEAETRNLPIVMLTARGEESDRIRGLNTGADDYVVQAVLDDRAYRPDPRGPGGAIIRQGLAEDQVRQGDICIDRVAHRVRRGDLEVHLGPTEFRLLDHFMRHPGRVFSREQLLDAVWGSDVYVETPTVDVHIGRLRRALGSVAGIDPIRTVRSAGYSLNI